MNSEMAYFVSLESQCFPKAQPRETLRFEGNNINCFPRNQSLRKTKKTTATADVGQLSRVTVHSDVIDFAMLPAQRLLSDVM